MSSSYQCLETAKRCLPLERCSLDLRFCSCRSRCASGNCALRWVGHKHVRGVDALFRALPSGSTRPLTMRRCGSKHHHHHHHIPSHLRSRARGTPCPRLLPPTLFPQSPRSAARHLHDRTTVNHSRLAARRMRYYTPRMNQSLLRAAKTRTLDQASTHRRSIHSVRAVVVRTASADDRQRTE